MSAAGRAARTHDERRHERVTRALRGQLFVPAEDFTMDCQVVNLSGGGAGLLCEEPPPLSSFVVLTIEGFGRLEAVTVWFVKGELGLRFLLKPAKRDRLLCDLQAFVNEGAQVRHLRRHPRRASDGTGLLALPDGGSAPYQVLDISLQGISVRIDIRPPVGALVHLGKTCGRVVRHHDDGIAIHFIQPEA